MFYIIDLTTGEVLSGPVHFTSIDDELDGLSAMYPLENLFVQAACDSEFGLFAENWLGIA